MELTKRSSYYYDLPEELIAQSPMEKRDSSRLLVMNKETQTTEDRLFSDIIDYFDEGDCLVINNTRVIPARLFGTSPTHKGEIEVVLLNQKEESDVWECLTRPGKKTKIGEKVIFDESFSAEVTGIGEGGVRLLKFNYKGSFFEVLDRIGAMPLPPYITKKLEDKTRYQTVYAQHNGSAAAPTAGLHFTDELLEKLRAKGVKTVSVLLHVGLGTFRPVKEDDITNHIMHKEYIKITKEAAETINKVKENGKRVFAVGTTSCRVLESVTDDNGKVNAFEGQTGIFIYPGYKFKCIDALITNFHLPESTLLMLVSAFSGYDFAMNSYKSAVEKKYRFFSFGDAMLIV